MEYGVYFESDYGMESLTITARDAADMMRQLKEICPNDIGADGFYDDPVSGNERPLNW